MNWHDYFYYDETSPSCLRWKIKRKAANQDAVAGWDDQNDGYFRVQINNKQVHVHRIIYEMFNGIFVGVVDHIDNDRKNNKLANLQVVTVQQNCQKRKKRALTSTSKYKGVSWVKRDSKWRAGIKIEGRAYNLGTYASEEEAARGYDNKATEAFGEFALTNKKLGLL